MLEQHVTKGNNTCKDGEIKSSVKNGILNGLVFSLVPHLGCIAVIVLTLMGVTVSNFIFKNIFSTKWFSPAVIILSFVLAGLASFYYLRKNCCVNKKKYLVMLFSSVILVNVFLLYLVFPTVANIGGRAQDKNALNLSELKIQTDIPCSGHAPLIVYELKKAGVNEVSFINPDIFDIKYDSEKISQEDILNLQLFKDFIIKKVL